MVTRKTRIRPKFNAMHTAGTRPINGPLHKPYTPGTTAQGRFQVETPEDADLRPVPLAARHAYHTHAPRRQALPWHLPLSYSARRYPGGRDRRSRDRGGHCIRDRRLDKRYNGNLILGGAGRNCIIVAGPYSNGRMRATSRAQENGTSRSLENAAEVKILPQLAATVLLTLKTLVGSYCQELCMEGSRGVLFHPEPILENDAVHDLRSGNARPVTDATAWRHSDTV